jgi:hypothetical protein
MVGRRIAFCLYCRYVSKYILPTDYYTAKEEIHKTQNIAETEKIWTEIETLQWVLLESGSIRRQLGEKERI